MTASRPDRARMLAWLAREAVVDGGAVLSWVNPAHPGYTYPEAAGLVLGLLAQEPGSPPGLRRRLADRLTAEVGPTGALGRAGVDYLFDAGIVLHGLLLHVEAGGALGDPDALARLGEGVLAGIEGRTPRVPAAPGSDHWSDTWGCHLIKLALPLQRLAAGGERRAAAAAGRLVDELLGLWRGDRFVVHAGSERTYVHAGCYALEGLWGLGGGWEATARPILRAGAAWLASIQAEDGSLPAWHDGARGSGARPSDVVAQALRIWTMVDLAEGTGRFAAARARALGCLAARQHASGGIRYVEGEADVNSWCTAFAAQALAWAELGAEAQPWPI